MSLFVPMVKVLPEGTKGVAAIEHDTVSAFAASMAAIRGHRLDEGAICKLKINGRLWMSDGTNEHVTNYEVVRNAKGDVLLAGLGIGMILVPILKKPEVRSVTVIEKYQDVIDLVEPVFARTCAGKQKLLVICADIHEWKPRKGMRYDCIYFDVWADQSTDDLADMAKLHQRFKAYKTADGWMDSWNRESLKARKRRGF